MIRKLVADFRAGRVDSQRVRRAQMDGYAAFSLGDAAGVRPSLLSRELRLDDAWLRRVLRAILRAPRARSRIGKEWDPGATRPKMETDDHWVTRAELKPLDDACTRFCTRKFFPDAFARINLVANVIRLYERIAALADTRCDIVFKGGVMLRLVLLEFVHDFELPSRLRAVDYLSRAQKAVGVSDFDFEVVPRAHAPAAADTHALVAAHYAALLWLQRELSRELRGDAPARMLDLTWDREEAAEELRAALQVEVAALPRGHPLHGATVDRAVLSGVDPRPPRGYRTKGGRPSPGRRNNDFIFRDMRGDSAVADAGQVFAAMGVDAGDVTQPDDRLYATCNLYIGEGDVKARADQLLGLFHLARIKHAFVVYYTTADGEQRCDRLAGELVDVSQSHGTRHDEIRAALYANVARPYRTYPVLSVDPTTVALRSYSPQGFLFDHQTMLHNRDTAPWEVPKLAKRLLRYGALLVLCACSAEDGGPLPRRLGALEAICTGLDAVAKGKAPPPRKTGNGVADAFYARERESLRHGGDSAAKRRYAGQLRDHVRIIAACAARRGAWNAKTLLAMHVWHTDFRHE